MTTPGATGYTATERQAELAEEKRVSLRRLPRMPQLKRLSLREAQLDGWDWLDRVPNLEELVLEYTNIDEANLAQVSKLPRLESLDLHNTKISSGAMDKLRRSRAGLRVEPEVPLMRGGRIVADALW